jgi:hypothetical protein
MVGIRVAYSIGLNEKSSPVTKEFRLHTRETRELSTPTIDIPSKDLKSFPMKTGKISKYFQFFQSQITFSTNKRSSNLRNDPDTWII